MSLGLCFILFNGIAGFLLSIASSKFPSLYSSRLIKQHANRFVRLDAEFFLLSFI